MTRAAHPPLCAWAAAARPGRNPQQPADSPAHPPLLTLPALNQVSTARPLANMQHQHRAQCASRSSSANSRARQPDAQAIAERKHDLLQTRHCQAHLEDGAAAAPGPALTQGAEQRGGSERGIQGALGAHPEGERAVGSRPRAQPCPGPAACERDECVSSDAVSKVLQQWPPSVRTEVAALAWISLPASGQAVSHAQTTRVQQQPAQVTRIDLSARVSTTANTAAIRNALDQDIPAQHLAYFHARHRLRCTLGVTDASSSRTAARGSSPQESCRPPARSRHHRRRAAAEPRLARCHHRPRLPPPRAPSRR